MTNNWFIGNALLTDQQEYLQMGADRYSGSTISWHSSLTDFGL